MPARGRAGDGRSLERVRGGANLQAVGELAVEKVLHDVMDEAIGERGIVPAAICLGIAGVDRPDDHAVIRGIMKRIGCQARILVVNDALVALEAGAPEQPGVVVISGTGSIAYGRNARGEAARAGGWGYVLGDEGSGYWIGRAALRAVLRESDRARARRRRSRDCCSRISASIGPQGLIHEVYHTNLKPAAIGALATCVQEAFTAGDAVAHRDSSCAPRTSSRAQRCRSPVGSTWSDSHFTFILAGGIFRAVPWLTQELERRLPVAAPNSRARLLDREPAEGAVDLALQEARGGATGPCL